MKARRGRTVADLLAEVPEVYDQLGDRLAPGGSPLGRRGEDAPTGHRPLKHETTPANLDLIEHRHLLVRGLRYWVAVAQGQLGLPERVQVLPDMRHACRWLAARAPHLTVEQQAELFDNLDGWLEAAYDRLPGLRGRDLDAPDLSELPPEAAEQRLRVHEAAKLLGCSVRTIQRRVPAERRPDGTVRLGDVLPRCDRHDMIAAWCSDCADAAHV